MSEAPRCHRRPTWSRSGARPARNAGSRRTPRSTTRSAGASFRSRGRRRRQAGRLGTERRRRAGAAHPARPVPAQHVSRPGARLRHRSAGARRREPRHPQRLRRQLPDLRGFFYLPFEHSENLADQERAIALYKAAGDADGLKWAELHADIIRRFGRFPHRNAVLGRVTTAEEQTFLDDGGFAG